MAEKEYDAPVWSYPDSLGPAIHYGHTNMVLNGLVPPYKGRQLSGIGSNDKASPKS